jgi:hypothetical protein
MKVTLSHKDVTKALQQYIATNFGPNMVITDLNFDVTRNPRTVAFDVEIQNRDNLTDEEADTAAAVEAGIGKPGVQRASKPKATSEELVDSYDQSSESVEETNAEDPLFGN